MQNGCPSKYQLLSSGPGCNRNNHDLPSEELISSCSSAAEQLHDLGKFLASLIHSLQLPQL